jgi:phage tail-like protein
MKSERIAPLLPEIFQRTLKAEPDVLGAFLKVMETLHAPGEDALENLELYLNPRQTLDTWLPFLAAWVDMDRFLDNAGAFPGGKDRLRGLILAALHLSKIRGTRQGLIAFLEIATGLKGFRVEDAAGKPYHIIVTSPAPGDTFTDMNEDQYSAWLTDLIHSEKPAYITSELRIQSAAGKSGARASRR